MSQIQKWIHKVFYIISFQNFFLLNKITTQLCNNDNHLPQELRLNCLFYLSDGWPTAETLKWGIILA